MLFIDWFVKYQGAKMEEPIIFDPYCEKFTLISTQAQIDLTFID